MSKKGQGISLTFIVVAALSLVALVVLILFFTGGIEKIFGKEEGIIQSALPEAEKTLQTNNCKTSCTLDNQEDFCKEKSYTVDGKVVTYSCSGPKDKGGLGVQCDKWDCTK